MEDLDDLENSEDEDGGVEQNMASLKNCPRNASMNGLGEYKTLKDMLVETSLDVDRIMDDEMDKYLDDEEEGAESDRPDASSLGNTSIDMLIEGETVEHFVNQCNGFYEEMKLKVSSLRRTPVVNNLIVKPKKDMDESNIFENMHHTPEVQKRLDAISKLDDDIKDIISTYKVERAARMEAQLEMCNELSQNPDCRERDSEKFLQACQFELSQFDSNEGDKNEEDLDKPQQKPKSDGRFIKRNAELAKEGYLASCSLTDEEKSKIEEIMSVIDCDTDKKGKNKSLFTITDKAESVQTYTNAYTFDDKQSQRMIDIDTELEKFALDEKDTEKTYVSGLPKSYEDTGSICLLKKEMASIDEKLKELRNRDEEEIEKNRQRQLKLRKEHHEQEEKDSQIEDVDHSNLTKEVVCEAKVDGIVESKEGDEKDSNSADSVDADEMS